ncbi:MAG: cysteine--tRNA ligase [candidate division FCPU426 bacterium]
MPLYLHNTVTRLKEEFKPLVPGQVRMYACGPTVYDYFHVGNARAFVVFDTLRRVLERRGYQVTYVQNITDVDDKIIRRAKESGTSPQAVAQSFTQAFFEDLQALGCRPADISPKATEHIPEMLALIGRLFERGHAYQAGGDVFFSVRSLPGYGSLAGKPLDELEKGARVEVNPLKRDPLDFSLWKAAKPGEPAWDSPWGPGRPGWHIECSAMSMKYLGEQFDIHGGGEDLVFPHHENENAQSEGATGKPLARYWLHNGHLQIRGEKMSKSLGNFWITREVLRTHPAAVLRIFLLGAHYRSPLDLTPENLDAARQGHAELLRTVERLNELLRTPAAEDYRADDAADRLEQERNGIVEHFEAALDDDLNTAGALGQIYTLANRSKQVLARRPDRTFKMFSTLQKVRDNLRDMLDVLGLTAESVDVPLEVRQWVEDRRAARERREWAESDRLRDRIAERGFLLEDTPFGTLVLRAADEPSTPGAAGGTA